MIRIVRPSSVPLILSKRKASYDDIYDTVRKIIDDVKTQGDKALFRFRALYDHIRSDSLFVKQKDIDTAEKRLDISAREAFKVAIKRVTAFHKHEKRHISSWIIKESKGISYGELFTPIESIGLYVPGGRASYPSSLIMNAVPAIVAGVKNISVATPSPDNYVLATAGMLGIKRVLSMGGAHAIAALAYGTESVDKVDKITGPGSSYVTLAKKLVYGDIGIDMIAGPSEVVVIADGSVDPAYVAADLMAQAEHDEQAMSVLISLDKNYVKAVNKKLKALVAELNRKDIIKKSLIGNGFAVVAKDKKQAVDMANTIAPEHLELMVSSPKSYLKYVKHAGAVFLGAYTPEVLGDYVAGPDHVLPTMGAARFSSGLSVYDFMKRTTILEVKKNGFTRLAPYAEKIGAIEGFDAHIMAARIRTGVKKRKRPDTR